MHNPDVICRLFPIDNETYTKYFSEYNFDCYYTSNLQFYLQERGTLVHTLDTLKLTQTDTKVQFCSLYSLDCVLQHDLRVGKFPAFSPPPEFNTEQILKYLVERINTKLKLTDAPPSSEHDLYEMYVDCTTKSYDIPTHVALDDVKRFVLWQKIYKIALAILFIAFVGSAFVIMSS